MLKKELWAKQQITVDIKMIQKKQVVKETALLEEIQQNGTREHEVVKKLDKEDISLKPRRFENKFYRKITILQILDIQDNKG